MLDTITVEVRPVDDTEPGSYQLRRRIRKLMRTITAAADSSHIGDLDDAMDEIDAIFEQRIILQPGQTLAGIMAELSQSQYRALLQAMLTGKGEAVPPESGKPSP